MEFSPSLDYLALGDSYTIGDSVLEGERFPVQTVSRLRDKGITCADPLIVASSSWTTDELHQGILTSRPSGSFDMVSLLIGVNNQYRGLSLDDYATSFQTLLDLSLDFVRGSTSCLFVLSIPDWGVTPFAEGRDKFAIARSIDAFNDVNRKLTEKIGAHYLDITPLTRGAAVEPELIAEDGLHPSAKAYAQWAELLSDRMAGEWKTVHSLPK
jgi:hypothetical protein